MTSLSYVIDEGERNVVPGLCPKCYKVYVATESGYFCTSCGDAGWFFLGSYPEKSEG